jgi:hypothetical protein
MGDTAGAPACGAPDENRRRREDADLADLRARISWLSSIASGAGPAGTA